MSFDQPCVEISLTLHKCCLRGRLPEIMEERYQSMLVLVPLKDDHQRPHHALVEVALEPLRKILSSDGAATVDVGPYSRIMHMGIGYAPDAVTDAILSEYAAPLLPLEISH